MTIVKTPKDSFACLGVIAAGIPVYGLGVKWKKPKAIQDKIDAFTIFVQKLSYCIFDESKLKE